MQPHACSQHSGAHAENLIRHKARQLVGTYGFTEADRDDLEQELRVDLMRRLGKFNPAKAKLSTFTARVVEHCIATIIEARKAAKRDYRECDCSFNEPLTFEDGDDGELGDTIACETYMRRLSPASAGHVTRRDMSIDVASVLALLPQEQQRLCALLREHTVLEISDICQIPRGTIYDRIKEIRIVFEDAALGDYVRRRSDRSSRGPVGDVQRAE
jgi:RNA polymerase sigma-70 factor (ECF subfamily)